MKRFFTAAAIAVLISCFGCGSEQPADEAKEGVVLKQSSETVKTSDRAPGAAARTTPGKYAVKSGILHFEAIDFVGTHKEIIYFDDYGRKECHERFDADGTLAETRFCDGKQLYKLDNEKNTAYILSANAGSGTEMRFDKNGFSARQKEKYHYQDKPDMTIAGKNCEAFYMETGSGKTVFAGWSHITLYHNQETKFGNIVRTATLVEEDVSVPQNKFEVPAGYETQEAY